MYFICLELPTTNLLPTLYKYNGSSIVTNASLHLLRVMYSYRLQAMMITEVCDAANTVTCTSFDSNDLTAKLEGFVTFSSTHVLFHLLRVTTALAEITTGLYIHNCHSSQHVCHLSQHVCNPSQHVCHLSQHVSPFSTCMSPCTHPVSWV